MMEETNHQDSRIVPPIMHLDAFPFEVFSNIFSHLAQADILRCMAVSRLWAARIPAYSVRCWASVRLYSERGGLANRRLAACLGPHVRRVSLSGYKSAQELELTLRVLIDLDCLYIESLAKQKWEEFYNTHAAFIPSFYHALRQLSVCLTSISFLRHSGTFDFFDVISACPDVTSFDCSLTEAGEMWACKMPIRTEITHLCLSSRRTRFDPQLELILFQCRKLKFFATNNPWIQSPEEIDKLVRLCPSIQYFEYGFGSMRKARHYRNKYFQDDKQSKGLRELTVSGIRMTQDMTNVFQHLERLIMVTCLLTLASFPPTLRLDHLRVLVCKLVGCDEPFNLATVLRMCPNLEELSTNSFPLNTDMTQALTETPRLRKLVLRHNMMLRPEDDLALDDLLRAISSLPLLAHLHLCNLLTPRTVRYLANLASLERLEIEIAKAEVVPQLVTALSVNAIAPPRIRTLVLNNMGNLSNLLALDKLSNFEHLEHLTLDGSFIDGSLLQKNIEMRGTHARFPIISLYTPSSAQLPRLKNAVSSPSPSIHTAQGPLKAWNG
ncbi:hypothetical protein BX666DRAFT_2119628 [Dichotomocladium elegans]|nr:hypothetical protein BX666DRAFT_2119628 [Dichotomocladium elegans]